MISSQYATPPPTGDYYYGRAETNAPRGEKESLQNVRVRETCVFICSFVSSLVYVQVESRPRPSQRIARRIRSSIVVRVIVLCRRGSPTIARRRNRDGIHGVPALLLLLWPILWQTFNALYPLNNDGSISEIQKIVIPLPNDNALCVQ